MGRECVQLSNKVYRNGRWIWTGVKKQRQRICFEINSMFRTSVHRFYPDMSRAYNMVRVIGVKLYGNDLKRNKNYFELVGGLFCRTFEIPIALCSKLKLAGRRTRNPIISIIIDNNNSNSTTIIIIIIVIIIIITFRWTVFSTNVSSGLGQQGGGKCSRRINCGLTASRSTTLSMRTSPRDHEIVSITVRIRSDGILYRNLAAFGIIGFSIKVRCPWVCKKSFTSSTGSEVIRFHSLRGYDQRYNEILAFIVKKKRT